MEITISSIHFTADSKLSDFITDKISKLDNYSDRIISANVTLSLEKSGQVQDKVVEIKIGLPGTVLFSKEVNKSFEAATDDAVKALRRQIVKYKERMRSH